MAGSGISETTRRALMGLTAGGGITALLAARFWPDAGEAKKKKKKKKKKKPVTEVARLVAPTMLGANEVPSGSGDIDGSGSALFILKSNGQICADFDVANIGSPTLMHIHVGVEGAEGDPVVDFSGFINDPDLAGCAQAGTALVNQIAANPAGFYANVHTAAHPGGAIRDQLEVDS